MEKLQIFIGAFFGGAYKALSEAKEDAAMKAFEADAEKVMEAMEAKDADIAEGVSALEAANASLESVQAAFDSAQADRAAVDAELVTAKANIEALEAKLSVFGADDDSRAAYAAEHENLQQMYADDERVKKQRGEDSSTPLGAGSKNDPVAAAEERKAKLAEDKKLFPKTFAA